MDDDDAHDEYPQNMPPTDWMVVREHGIDSEIGRACLNRLIETYSSPVYRFLRRRGHGREDAEEVTQGFFLRVLEKGGIRGADPSKGRFRDFLCRAVLNFSVDEFRRSQRERVGGKVGRVPFDHAAAELRHLAEDSATSDPELALHREFAEVLRERAHEALRALYEANEEAHIYALIAPFIFDPPSPGDYARIAAELDITTNYVGVLVHRMRRRWRRVALIEAARTCGSVEEAKAELDDLVATLRRGVA